MSKSIKDLTEQINVAVPYLKANNERLKFSTTGLEVLKKLRIDWNAIIELTSSPLTRTPALVAEMHQQQEVLERTFRAMQQNLKYSFEVNLTDEDRKVLGIPKRKTRSEVPAPKITPVINIVSRGVRALTIQLYDPINRHLNYRKLPKGVHSVNVFTAITEANDPEPAKEDYHLFKNESKSNIKLSFNRGDEKKVVYICVAFLNSKGQSGPISNSVDSVISN